MTSKPTTRHLRLPAEWEPQGAVMISWPHRDTDWAYMMPQVEECYDAMVRAIARHATAIIVAPDTTAIRARFADIPAGDIIYFDTPTNDTWIRDYGAITVRDADGSPVLCDFGFNAWGGKFDSALDNGVTRRMVDAGLLRGRYLDLNDFILEGGSIESDGCGTILTTSSCLLTPTRNGGKQRSRTSVEQKLRETLGARNILWLESGDIIGDDTDGHIDTIARLAPYDTILYCVPGPETESDEQSLALAGVARCLSGFATPDGIPYNLVELPMPDAIYDPEDGHRLPATYANFLIINDAVLLPIYGQPLNDERAAMTLRIAFPDHIIEPVDCRALIRQHGSLHCATMQVPADVLPL